MRARLLLALGVLLLPGAASADPRVMCYGDSITAGSDMFHPETSYPAQLQRLRPDLEVVNEGQGGDVSNNLDRFHQALAFWQPRLVVLMMGTNDPVCNPADTPFCASATAAPERSAANLFQMATAARREGADVIILTPLPAACKEFCQPQAQLAFAMAVRDAFTGRVAEELLSARPPAGVRVADLRGAFSDASWDALSTEGLHPSAEGNVVIAKFVAARIAKRSAARVAKRSAAREPQPSASEPDPFVRRPSATPPR